MNNTVLAVEGLTMRYSTREGSVQAVEDVSFELQRGETLGFVGESGCGKTSLAIALLRLLPDNAQILTGHVYFKGQDLVPLGEGEMRRHRWKGISMIFQAAMNCLNPVYRVGDQIVEAILAHDETSPEAAKRRVRDLFKLVGLEEGLIDRYPHEYSGGMKQRAIIAMALACEPDVVIADEPTTALDVLVQDRILRELRDIQGQINMSMIYISHDIAAVAEMSHRIAVMYAGKIIEVGATVQILRGPLHPYTEALMSAFPSLKGEKQMLESLPGEPPDLISPPSGCRFHPRCPFADSVCREREPQLESHQDHEVACWHPLR